MADKNKEENTSEEKTTIESLSQRNDADEAKASSSNNSAEATKTPPLLKDAVVSPPEVKKQGRGLGLLALLVAFVAVAVAAYSYWQLQQYKTTVQAINGDSQSQMLASFDAKVQQLTGKLADVDRQANARQQVVKGLQDQLQTTRRQMGEITHVSRQSWMLAETEYLLRLANQRLLLERDTDSTLALLIATDKILLDINEPGLFKVRETIAREVATLRAVGQVDVEGVFVKLAALGEQVQSLALIATDGPAAENVQAPAAVLDKTETGVFSDAMKHLNELVKVRHRDEPLAPLLTPEQHYYVQQNLRLMLEQAQLALLDRKADLYSQSLVKAERWVKQYFQLNEAADALLASLVELRTINVNPQLPDISASLTQLKAYLKKADHSVAATISATRTAEKPVPQSDSQQTVEGAAQ